MAQKSRQKEKFFSAALTPAKLFPQA